MASNVGNTPLSNEQQNSLQLFQEISQITDINLCIDILNRNRWNVDLAIESFIHNRGSTSSYNDSSQSTHSIPQALPQQEIQRRDSQSGNVFIDTLLNPLKWLFQTHPISLNPDLDSRNFKSDFESKYGSNHPTFYEKSYNSAVTTAFRGPKFLLVYLHSPLHDDTNRFCRQVLNSQNLSRVITDNMVFWGGRVWDPEAYGLGIQLGVSSFPFLALLVCQSERSVQVVDKIQGMIEERLLIERLQNTITAFGSEINRMRQEVSMREQSTQLREEQDREYREAMEADRKARERKQQEIDLQTQREEEERQREELENALRLSQQLARETVVTRARAALTEEPAANDALAAMIRFQLPQGTKIARRFRNAETIQMVYDYLTVYFDDNKMEIKNFVVSTNYPKRQMDDMSMNMELAGLYPRGMLFVQDLDAVELNEMEEGTLYQLVNRAS
eukprot:gene7510-15368_t